MFGERYFATRQKLATVVHDTRELARTAGVELNGFAEESELLRGLQNPFLFVVCGEVNAGKSTLINGLFGEELCPVNVLPETERVLWYRYGEKARDDEITEVLEERYRPIDFLSDFHIVDTPGTNSVIRGHQAITERFLPVADLVLFVFPVGNPWGAATWDFIARFPEELRGKVAFVLQQKDLRDEDELVIIMDHMRQLARRKLGEAGAHEIFAVSGKLAVEAKKRAPFEQKLWKASGYPELEAFISKVVTSSPARRRVLREVRDATSSALRRIESHLDAAAGAVDRKARALRDFETEADRQHEDFAVESERTIALMGEVYERESAEVRGLLRRSVAVWPSVRSLFRRDESLSELEKALSQAIESAIGALTDEEARELEGHCIRQWDELRPRMVEALGVVPPGVDGGAVDRDGARQRLVRRMARSAKQSLIRMKLRGQLEMQLDLRRRVLQRFLVGALFFLSTGGALGAFELHPYSWLAVGVAVALGALGMVQARRSGARVLRWFGGRVADSRDAFTEMLSGEYREGVREFLREYAALFGVLRREIVKAKTALQPQQKEWSDLFRELKMIERDL